MERWTVGTVISLHIGKELMMLKNRWWPAIAAVATLVRASSSFASLIGTSIDISSPHGSGSGIVVGPGVDFFIWDTPAQNDDSINIDVMDSSIVIEIEEHADNGGTAWTTAPTTFDVVISGLTWVDHPAFSISSISTNFEFVNGSPFGGSLSTALTDSNEVTFSFNNFDSIAGNEISARFTIDIVPVPEPASLSLIGLSCLAFGRRKRRRLQ